MSSHVFISYAREDHDTALRLRDDLLRIGVTPWMDAFDLVGGQDWRQAIKQALRSSSHVTLLVSTHTVSKRGYVQTEVKEALELLPVIGQRAKVSLLNLLGFATLLPCLLGMRLIAIAAREAGAGVNTALLDKFAQLRADLKWFLGSAAVIIGAATLANGAFMNVLGIINRKSQTPATEILLYGGFCSGVLALFYLFSHEVFSKSGWALINAAEPVLDDSTDAWADAKVRRSKLAEMMGVGRSSARRFQIGALLLTPLFGSGVALLLGRT